MSDSTVVDGNGSFEFRSVQPGTYTLRVIGGSNRLLHEEVVSIVSGQQPLSIHVSEPNKANRSADPTISVQELSHKVPKAAQKEYDKGRQAASKGNQDAAAQYFLKAVELDPEFVDAHNELGASEVALGKLPEAAEQFQKAIDLVPEHRLALPNLSIVLARMKRFKEAGDVARRALQLLPGSARMHYILGFSILVQHGDTKEALDNLKYAAAEIPNAHLISAEVLSQMGRRQEAAEQVEEYLRVQPSNDSQRAKAEALLAELRK
jgi:tetratricopeptide (TPR) repeat protein